MTNIHWDEFAFEDPVLYVRFDIRSCVGFRLDRNVPYLPNLFPPNRQNVDVYVREYYDASLRRPITGPDVSSVAEIPAFAPPLSSQLVISSTVQSVTLPRAQPVITDTVAIPPMILSDRVFHFRLVLLSARPPSVSTRS